VSMWKPCARIYYGEHTWNVCHLTATFSIIEKHK
jgi:hypothetical protein